MSVCHLNSHIGKNIDINIHLEEIWQKFIKNVFFYQRGN